MVAPSYGQNADTSIDLEPETPQAFDRAVYLPPTLVLPSKIDNPVANDISSGECRPIIWNVAMNPSAVKRKLTTILVADVVGYSKLMASDEEGTYKSLKNLSDFINYLVTRHDGRIFNEVGDAFLVEFDSAVEAVRCAIAMQEDFAARNIELPRDEQMWLRIGVNVGDVMIDGGNLLGDGNTSVGGR